MADPQSLQQDALNFASRAVQCDQNGLVDTAIFYYTEAAQALLSASLAGAQGLIDKANEYIHRAEQLKQSDKSRLDIIPKKSQIQLDLERAEFLIRQAFDEDESQNTEEALELYTQAASLCLQLRKKAEEATLRERVTRLAKQALDRGEQLKQIISPPSPPPVESQTKPAPAAAAVPKRQPAKNTGPAYTKEEISVLRITSNINGRDYVPFMSVDIQERFGYPLPFSDKHGKLALSPKQQNHFDRWVRPDEFLDNPQMIYAISSFSIKQTVVSDCSFVASLAISAQYERRFKKKLITSIIYPQNRQGEPQYNPCGKYMVRLNINGVPRKVIIDDYLPISRSGELLCSYSSNRNELWVSLLEKAYMKVMGGYDFPGSNSNIDLHALTGWIPERVAIRLGSEEFNPDREFDRIMDRFHKGHCLVTVATGDIPEAEADRAGLVPTHAYAFLDIRKVKNYKLCMLKNPWSHLRWKGNFSEFDITHWTPEMCKLLNYDPKMAATNDNGVFWIDYDSLLKFFDVMYINWNPSMFSQTTCMHHTWKAKEGPKKDAYNIGDNPQYKLVTKSPGSHAVWILLTRHITDKDDFADNKEFITVLVYKTEGKRVYYPYDPAPYKNGTRINSPLYLCKMVEEKGGTGTYTLVISQYEKSNTIHYTLRVYSTCEFTLNRIAEPYIAKYEKHLTGKWEGRTAGGCSNYRDTTGNNPIYQVKIDNKSATNQILVELRGPKQYSVGFEVSTVSENVPDTAGSFKKKSSGTYRRGYVVLEIDNIPGGVYNIQVTTFYPKEEGPFFLDVSSSVPISVSRIQ